MQANTFCAPPPPPSKQGKTFLLHHLLKVGNSLRTCTIKRLKGPLQKGLSLLIPHFNSSYPFTKPTSIAHQTFLSPSCHKKSPCFVRGVAQSASSRLNVGVKCTHRLELALWSLSAFGSKLATSKPSIQVIYKIIT